MINAILRLSVERRFLMLSLILVLVGVGVWSFQRLPIDAVTGHYQCPGADQHRSTGLLPPGGGTAHHLSGGTAACTAFPTCRTPAPCHATASSQVTVVFEEGTDLYFARNPDQRAPRCHQECPAARTGTGDGPHRDRSW